MQQKQKIQRSQKESEKIEQYKNRILYLQNELKIICQKFYQYQQETSKLLNNDLNTKRASKQVLKQKLESSKRINQQLIENQIKIQKQNKKLIDQNRQLRKKVIQLEAELKNISRRVNRPQLNHKYQSQAPQLRREQDWQVGQISQKYNKVEELQKDIRDCFSNISITDQEECKHESFKIMRNGNHGTDELVQIYQKDLKAPLENNGYLSRSFIRKKIIFKHIGDLTPPRVNKKIQKQLDFGIDTQKHHNTGKKSMSRSYNFTRTPQSQSQQNNLYKTHILSNNYHTQRHNEYDRNRNLFGNESQINSQHEQQIE